MAERTRKPKDPTLKEIEESPVTGETIEEGFEQERPTGREWDSIRREDKIPEDVTANPTDNDAEWDDDAGTE